MISKSFAVMGVLTLLLAAAHAGSAPKELYGKSMIITWTEQRSQRMFGQADFRNVNVQLSHKVYVSTKGQWFSRFSGGMERNGENGREAIGASATSPTGERPQFSGRTITMTGASKEGLGRRTTIEFNESFTTCEAHIIVAKQAGSDVVIGHSLVTGAANKEIRSAAVTGGPSCSVRDGNVFAQ
jgi:hypothetical protein